MARSGNGRTRHRTARRTAHQKCKGLSKRRGWLAASRDRLRTLLDRVLISSERKIELLPYRNQGVSQSPDQPRVVCRGGGNPQSLGAAGNRRIIDRLNVDAVLVKEEVARLLAQVGVPDHNRNDVRLRR